MHFFLLQCKHKEKGADMGTAERRMEIFRVLCERRHDTIENLAKEFGVCIRTIKYDVESLSITYPIYTVKGPGGGVYIMDGYRSNRSHLTDKQVALLERLKKTLVGEELRIMESIIKTFSKCVQYM